MDKKETEFDEVINKLKVCPNCKAIVNGETYCHNCGKYLSEDKISTEKEQSNESEIGENSTIEAQGGKKINAIQGMFIGIAVSLVVAVIGIIIAFTDTTGNTSTKGTVTLSNYYKIEEGMSYDKVIDLLGNYSSKENAFNMVYCFWLPTDRNGNVTDIVSVTFIDGKVTNKNWQEMGGNSY